MLPQQINELRVDEGRFEKVYDDATEQLIVSSTKVQGHPTIGIGRALDVHGLSDDEIEFLFHNDILRVEVELSSQKWYVGCNDVRRGVLENMCFQLGLDHLLEFKMMIEALLDQNYEEAAKLMKDSEWYRQTQSSRTSRLMQQMTSGVL